MKRQKITIIPADVEGSYKIGFKIRERIGISVINSALINSDEPSRRSYTAEERRDIELSRKRLNDR